MLATLQKTVTLWSGALPEAILPGTRPDSWLPNQAAVLWISFAVMLAAGFDFSRPRDPRHVDLLLLQLLGWLFLDILSFLDHLRDPARYRLMDWVFAAVVGVTFLLLVRAVRRGGTNAAREVRSPMRLRAFLPALALALLALDVATALYAPPDDAGYFINIGGQRLRERMRWPYGDPLLTATPSAAYGPVLYAAHVPFQLLLAPEPVNAVSLPRPRLDASEPYYLPPLMATRLCTITFHLLGVAALFAAARRLAGAATAWALVALYCASPFVLGVGGAQYSIGGMTFTSHIAPAALTLLAFALLAYPAWSGVALAAGIGALFYPVFLVPAWVGYYWADAPLLRRFLVGFGLASVLIGGSVLLLSEPANGRGLVGTILYDTLGHQETPEAYGSSPFGFWGQRTGIRGWLMSPLAGTQAMSRPIVLAFFAFAASMWWFARQRTPAQFALLVAAVAMGAQLWKIHATATYVTWYYPFLLLGLFCNGSGGVPHAESRPNA
jgi:MFS family permease